MTERSVKIFSLHQANEIIPLVADATMEVVQRLDAIRHRHKVDFSGQESAISESVLNEVEEALQNWSERIIELGAHPKGYFTVDFQSVDPELLYCWSYGEDKISFTHKVWENYSHRRPLGDNLSSWADHLKWVN